MKRADSGDLLVALQDIRRRYPATADAMNIVIDLLAEGDVIEAVDAGLRRICAAVYDRGEIYRTNIGAIPKPRWSNDSILTDEFAAFEAKAETLKGDAS
jgi:hypothetical protein